MLPAPSPEVQYLPPAAVQHGWPQGMSQPGMVQPATYSTLMQLQLSTHERELELVEENALLQAQTQQQRQEQRRQRSQRDLDNMMRLLQSSMQQQLPPQQPPSYP